MVVREIEIHYEEQSGEQHDRHEDGVEIPFERLNPETLRNLISEFVTRQWEELGDAGYTLDGMIGQVLKQLQEKKVKVVFDLAAQTANIVVNR